MASSTPGFAIRADDSGYATGSSRDAKMDLDSPQDAGASPTPQTLKRKASLDNAQSTAKEVKKPAAKKQKAEPVENKVELKNGKLVFKQKSLGFAKLLSTVTEQIAFRKWLEEQDEAVKTIPAEHWPLFAKLVHESEKTLNELAKSIRDDLDPANEDSQAGQGNMLPLDVVKAAINAVADRENYGLTMSDSPDADVNPPPGLLIYRWEARNHDHLPEDLLARIQERKAARVDARSQAREMIEKMTLEEHEALFTKGKKVKKPEVVDVDAESDKMDVDGESKEKKAPKEKKAKKEKKEETPEEREKREAEEAAKAEKKAEREAKKAENEVKKAEREVKKAEREAKKEAKQAKEDAVKRATAKQSNMLMGFFNKAPKAPSPPVAGSSSASPETTRVAPKTSGAEKAKVSDQSDFDSTFLPFQLRKDCKLAPVNRFTEGRDEPSEFKVNTHDELDLKTVLSDFLSTVPTDRIPRRAPRPKPEHAVSEIMLAITEGELAGNGGRKYYNQLKKLPVKTLKFHSDHRPGYRGTWTKASDVIRPRAPLSRDDTMLRYDYDSADEWEEEPEEGEDVNMEEEEVEEESDSDEDGWLANDDEAIEYEEGFEPGAEGGDLAPNVNDDPSIAQAKRVVEKRNQAVANQKRKITGALVALCKGVCFEAEDGSQDKFLATFRMEFLNEARPGVEPLTYDAATPEFVKNGQTSLKGFYATSNSSTSKAPKAPSSASTSAKPASGKSTGPKKSSFPTKDIPSFISFIEATDITGKAKLRDALYERFDSATKVSVDEIFKAHVKQTGSLKNKNLRWEISQELRDQAQRSRSSSAAA